MTMSLNEHRVCHPILLCNKIDSVTHKLAVMLPLRGLPYIDYLLKDIKRRGFEKVTLCTGKNASSLIHYVKNGEAYQLQIDYAQEASFEQSGRAIKNTIKLHPADEYFIFSAHLYTPFEVDEFDTPTSSSPVTTVLRLNRDDDLLSDYSYHEGKIVRARLETSCGMSEGFMSAGLYRVHQEIFNILPDGPFSFEDFILSLPTPKFTIFPRRIYDLTVESDYRFLFNNVDPSTLPPLSKAIFLDRDGVIIKDRHYLKDPNEVELYPLIKDIIEYAYDNNFLVICITNQAGIAKGYFDLNDHERVMSEVERQLAAKGTPLKATYFCPYHPDGLGQWKRDSIYRKPYPGMVLDAAAEFHIDLKKSIMIGDRATDIIHDVPLKTYIIKGEYDLPSVLKATICENHQDLLLKLRLLARSF